MRICLPSVHVSKLSSSSSLALSSAKAPDAVWSLGRLNHVAIAVPDLEAATTMYRDVLGAAVSSPQVSAGATP